jgi:hypothetical protein
VASRGSVLREGGSDEGEWGQEGRCEGSGEGG